MCGCRALRILPGRCGIIDRFALVRALPGPFGIPPAVPGPFALPHALPGPVAIPRAICRDNGFIVRCCVHRGHPRAWVDDILVDHYEPAARPIDATARV